MSLTRNPPNTHPEEDKAWKMQRAAFADYYINKRAQDENQLKRDLSTYKRKEEEKEFVKLYTYWKRIDTKEEGDENEKLVRDPVTGAIMRMLGTSSLKEPGDYREGNSETTVRLSRDGTISLFGQKLRDMGHQHTDPDFSVFKAIKEIYNFKENHAKMFDFAAGQCGASSVEIDFPMMGKNSVNRLFDLLAMAESRKIEVSLSQNVKDYLATMPNGRRAEAVYDRVAQVNKAAEERKNDPEFINRTETSMLQQYVDDLSAKKADTTKLDSKLRKEADKQLLVNETLKALEKEMEGEKVNGKEVPGFDQRMKGLELATKELEKQLDKTIGDTDLTTLERDDPAAEKIMRRDEGKQDLRSNLLNSLNSEAEDLRKRHEVMKTVLGEAKTEAEKGLPGDEKMRTELQKTQQQRIDTLEKKLAAQENKLNEFGSSVDADKKSSRLGKLEEKNTQLTTAVKKWEERSSFKPT